MRAPAGSPANKSHAPDVRFPRAASFLPVRRGNSAGPIALEFELMKTLIAAIAILTCAGAVAPGARAGTYTLNPLKKADKLGDVLPVALTDGGLSVGTVNITGSGSLAYEALPTNLSYQDYCGVNGTADLTQLTSISPYSFSEFVVGDCANQTAFLYNLGSQIGAQVAYPGSFYTVLTGVNGGGIAVGAYLDSQDIYHGFYYLDGSYIKFDPLGSYGTFAQGMNTNSTVFGTYQNAAEGDYNSGFLLDIYGNYTIINAPNASYTEITGLNSQNQAAGGFFLNQSGAGETAFAWQNGAFTVFPLASKWSRAVAINENGTVAGNYFDASGHQQGFVWQPSTGQVITVSGPAGTKYVTLDAINNQHAQVTGTYVKGHKSIAFTATCSGANCF